MKLLRWPRTLVARLFLIFIAGLVLAQALSFGLLFYERYEATRSMMLGDLEHESSVAIDILNRLPPAERADWLPRLSNSNRQYLLGPAEADQPLTLAAAQAAAQSLEEALGSRWPLSIHAMRNDARHIQAEVTLADGEPVVLDIHLSMRPLALWLPLVLLAQLLLLIACAGLAVRLAVRPLTRLAHAADTLDPNRLDPRRQQAPLAESGPAEVAQAATAFNAMQTRIASHLAERMQMLGSISHDLQTPITRMKLRAEAMDESTDRDKLMQDLDEVERLVREGIDYARSAHGSAEKTVKLDLNAFLDSLVCDYQDTGKDVSLSGHFAEPVLTRAHALRRVLGNLIDNALKFVGSAEVLIEAGPTPVIVVQDRGPGIPDDQLEAVLQPFYRLETSRNRGTGGTGLGLAIAQQLAQSLGGSLTLSARPGGGLVARVVLPVAVD